MTKITHTAIEERFNAYRSKVIHLLRLWRTQNHIVIAELGPNLEIHSEVFNYSLGISSVPPMVEDIAESIARHVIPHQYQYYFDRKLGEIMPELILKGYEPPICENQESEEHYRDLLPAVMDWRKGDDTLFVCPVCGSTSGERHKNKFVKNQRVAIKGSLFDGIISDVPSDNDPDYGYAIQLRCYRVATEEGNMRFHEDWLSTK